MAEKRKTTKAQTCKDCSGDGELYEYDEHDNIIGDIECPTCKGARWINRTGPYKLLDGTWSDGVDRSERISSRKFGELNPDRHRVICQRRGHGKWRPMSLPFLGLWPSEVLIKTHAEAIAYADKAARSAE